jgi:hypothetical protein
MIPDDIEEFKSEGEGIFYKFLRSVAKPDSKFISWYTPDINGKEPDFILFSDDTGLIIFEVKDWALDQIVEANPKYFVLAIGNKTESRKNPFEQARDYLYSVKDKIEKDGQLVSREPNVFGKLKIPIDYGIVFPNINKSEYTQKGLNQVISDSKIFFWDDLYPDSEICKDPSGQCFLNALTKMFPAMFNFKINGKELAHLKGLIFPAVRVELPRRESGDGYSHEVQRLRILDHHQEAIARKYDGGHRIVVGPSGSGKTLILVHKAALLKQYNPEIKNILFVCFNITLVNYIKRLLSDKGVALGDGGVEIFHFYQLCSKILGEEVSYESEDSDYYRLVVQETLSKLKGKEFKYDAILVDEGQDFSDEMLMVITSLLNPKTNSLTIALDDHQMIYLHNQRWKDLGIEAQGRVHRLTHAYRNTREISDFASALINKKDEKVSDQLEDPQGLFPDIYGFNGPMPEIRQCKSIEDLVAYVSDHVKRLVESKEYSCSEIGIIYTVKTPHDMPEKHIPRMFEKALESRGILYKWASEDYQTKRFYDITTNSVTISTIHSVKGLDFSCVFLVGLDFLEPGKMSWDQMKNLTYVGITRARHRLVIPYLNKTELVVTLLGSIKAIQSKT